MEWWVIAHQSRLWSNEYKEYSHWSGFSLKHSIERYDRNSILFIQAIRFLCDQRIAHIYTVARLKQRDFWLTSNKINTRNRKMSHSKHTRLSAADFYLFCNCSVPENWVNFRYIFCVYFVLAHSSLLHYFGYILLIYNVLYSSLFIQRFLA